ncbi:MAG: M64 family metallopeptidase [Bacteroidales bacterium]
MKKLLLITFLACFSIITSHAQSKKDVVSYNQYFTSARMRVDLILAGNADQQKAYLQNIHKEKAWGGTKTFLIDPFEYGSYYYKVFAGEKLIFSHGFCSLFQEWRTTADAKVNYKAFTNCIWMPYPKEIVKLVIYERIVATGKFKEMSSFEIDPTDKLIMKDSSNDFKVDKIVYNGNPTYKMDLVFVAEGYTKKELSKFRADCKKFSNYLFETEPYKTRKKDINIWAVESISKDSGTDFPHKDIWKNTICNSNFYTFKVPRYLTAPDHLSVAKLVSNVPFDAIYVLVNEKHYGGGGIYNYYCMCCSDDKLEAKVFIHEFGHAFAGLGDEYYTSKVAYSDMYPTDVEPWEPNLTTRVNFESKWKDMITPGTPIPTPNVKTDNSIIGLFEGGGYLSKGVYRPCWDCRMNSNEAKGYCPVCQRAITRMLNYYTR